MQTLWKAGTVYVSMPGEVSDIGMDRLNEMRLGTGVPLLGVARFRCVVMSPHFSSAFCCGGGYVTCPLNAV
jgi:hypothetical protein